MIVVDSSVIIANFREAKTVAAGRFAELSVLGEIIVGDLVRLEILQGARDEQHARKLAISLNRFVKANMLDEHVAVEAARNFRYLQSHGITIRKTTDLIIGTFCIVGNHELLHDDRDFEPMQRHLGLRVI